MKEIFYFLTLAPILWEMLNITDTKKCHRFILALEQLTAKKWNERTSLQKTYPFCQLLYYVWTLCGFLSFQWPAFALLFLLSFIPKKYVWYRWMDAVISMAILIFILMNAYHFQIDLWKFITE